MTYIYRVKASNSSHYTSSFDDVKDAVSTFIENNDFGVVYAKSNGIDTIVFRFCPQSGLLPA